jgi:hypothetical protein
MAAVLAVTGALSAVPAADRSSSGSCSAVLLLRFC